MVVNLYEGIINMKLNQIGRQFYLQDNTMVEYWYTLHSHPHKEEILSQQAQSNGIEVFYPRIRVHPVNPRSSKIRPYFPGYIFVRTDLEQVGLSVFQWMPYSTGLVTFGGEPALVPDNLIQAIRRRVSEIAEAGGEIFDGLKHGDPVDIESGPFAGYQAIFDVRLPGSERVRVLLKMLSQREVMIEMQASQIQKRHTPSRQI
jgi:transcription antitermination factor NusG